MRKIYPSELSSEVIFGFVYLLSETMGEYFLKEPNAVMSMVLQYHMLFSHVLTYNCSFCLYEGVNTIIFGSETLFHL